MCRKLTFRQREVLADLVAHGEAIKQGPYFQADGIVFCQLELMERLATMRMVRIDRIGGSTFAVPTDKGRAALAHGQGARE